MVNSPSLQLRVGIERFPIRGTFTISRGAKTEAVVVVATLSDGAHQGRGECVPYARYGETPEGTLAAIERMRTAIVGGLDRIALQAAMPAGAARNALDCALWDLEAKRSGQPVWQRLGLPSPRPLTTAFTISLGAPEKMAADARAAGNRPLLKIKLGAPGDRERIQAVRNAVPQTELIVDANEGWSVENLADNLAACAAARVLLVEQPLPANEDAALRGIRRPVPVCADESVHDLASLPALAGKYEAVNIKLDKAGGLTEAMAMAAKAEQLGLSVMVGCMVATSLAMAPAMLLAQGARFADLDGPLLLARDREHGLRYDGSTAYPPEPVLWG